MESSLVRRDQFNISPQGIVHKPTDAAFTPSPHDPLLGTTRLGTLANKHPNGNGYNSGDVLRMMRGLWAASLPTRGCLNVRLPAFSRLNKRPACLLRVPWLSTTLLSWLIGTYTQERPLASISLIA